MITLNGVELNGSMLWSDRDSFSSVAQSTYRTLRGKLLIFAGGLQEGRPITLEATEEYGWLKHSSLIQLRAMAAVPGAVYALNVHGETFSVVFRHNEAPAIDVKPMKPRAVPEPDDYYTGTLKFMTV